MSELTEQDKAMIVCFWQDKGDLTCWNEWEEKQPLIEKEFPELIKAVRDLDASIKIMDLVINSIEENVNW